MKFERRSRIFRWGNNEPTARSVVTTRSVLLCNRCAIAPRLNVIKIEWHNRLESCISLAELGEHIMTPDTPLQSQKPLPKSRAVLETMFKHCDLCIAGAKTARHRSRQKFRLL